MRKITTYIITVLCLLLNGFTYNLNAKSTKHIPEGVFDKTSFEFHISPNPAKNSIVVKFDTKTTAKLLIHDSLGNKVLWTQINNELIKEISLDDLYAGIYFISAKTEAETVIKRFIKS